MPRLRRDRPDYGGRRVNNDDDFSVDDYRLQFTVKYDWNVKIGGD